MKMSSATRQAQLARAVADLNAGNEASATQICLALLHETPDDPAVHQLMATTALRAGRLTEAEKHIATSLRHRPQHVPTWLMAGQIAQARGDLRLAADRLEQAVALDPTREDVAFARCRIWIQLASGEQCQAPRKLDLAALMSDLLERFPDFAPGWAAIGADLEKAGQLDAAFLAVARATKASSSVAGYLKCAQLALQLNRRTEAAGALRQALDLDPAMAPIWFKFGVVLQDCRDVEGAILAYRRALALSSDMTEAATNLGIMLQETGEIDAAKRAYGQAIRARADSFGRIAQALTAAPKGELWIDLGALRAHLLALAD